MLGPFVQKPIPLHISPLMTREKPDSEVRHAIVDLSWPKNLSVNAGVMKDKYLGSSFVLNYPSVDDIVKKIVELGPGSLLYKVDISQAFRQLKVDPGDLDLLGLRHHSYFIDQSVPFGYRHGSVFFEKVTDSIRYIMRQQGYPHLYNYVDDLICCRLPSNIHQSFETLLQLLTHLGLTINPKKLVAPSTSLICLGILINTETRTMAVPPDKLDSIINMCSQWKNKNFCSKRQLQSLLGSLLYASKCVKPARTFLNVRFKMCQTCTYVSQPYAHAFEGKFCKDTIFLNREFFKDLNWFYTFLRQFNGVVYYDIRPVQGELHLDASLTGMGEIFDNQCYALAIPKNFKNYSIVHLGMVNILVALKIWVYQWQDKKIRSNVIIWQLRRFLPRVRQKMAYWGHVLVTYGCYLLFLIFLFILSIFLENQM